MASSADRALGLPARKAAAGFWPRWLSPCARLRRGVGATALPKPAVRPRANVRRRLGGFAEVGEGVRLGLALTGSAGFQALGHEPVGVGVEVWMPAVSCMGGRQGIWFDLRAASCGAPAVLAHLLVAVTRAGCEELDARLPAPRVVFLQRMAGCGLSTAGHPLPVGRLERAAKGRSLTLPPNLPLPARREERESTGRLRGQSRDAPAAKLLARSFGEGVASPP